MELQFQNLFKRWRLKYICGRAVGAITPIIGGIAPWFGPLQAILDSKRSRTFGVKNAAKLDCSTELNIWGKKRC